MYRSIKRRSKIDLLESNTIHQVDKESQQWYKYYSNTKFSENEKPEIITINRDKGPTVRS